MPARRFILSPVKKLLFEREISQTQFAQDIQVSYVYLNRVINGWETGSPELRQKIATYFGVPESELFSQHTQEHIDQKIVR
jgi:transcriptional regulator with XRE-family HTH domain